MREDLPLGGFLLLKTTTVLYKGSQTVAERQASFYFHVYFARPSGVRMLFVFSVSNRSYVDKQATLRLLLSSMHYLS